MSAIAAAVQAPLKVWLERDGALLRMRLARPKANVVDGEMIAALTGAFDAYKDDARVLGALIDHEGPNFSFGASVEEHLPERCEEMLASLHALIGRMLEWPKPILVCARGQCLGGGLELALAASLLFVAPQARLGQPEIRLGVIAPAASVLLALRIGQARAEDLLYSGRSITGASAVAWGLAAEAAEEPETAALIYFDKHLADKSAAALACAVHAARAPFAELARARLDDAEAYYLRTVMATRDAHEGLAAFIAKRPPVWEHR
jgi:cyclohexa-1,5-dienecarbonyl-CoA hydratase